MRGIHRTSLLEMCERSGIEWIDLMILNIVGRKPPIYAQLGTASPKNYELRCLRHPMIPTELFQLCDRGHLVLFLDRVT